MKKDKRLLGGELFYVELPSATDYVPPDIAIQDAYDEPEDENQGLTHQQVSEIADDSRRLAKEQGQAAKDDDSDTLFANTGSTAA